ncbi:MAG TPA: hypothetical protein VF389_11405 [Woeseiaceae bacterium]
MAEDYVATVRIRRPAKVTTDDRGRTVWAETIETAQLELVSTAQLKTILQSDDDESRSSIERLILSKDDGVLARDPATGLFEVISDKDLQAILASDDKLPPTRRPADVTLEAIGDDSGDALSLVSTQMLRKIIKPDTTASAGNMHKKSIGGKPAGGRIAEKKDKSGGFDPYNSG